MLEAITWKTYLAAVAAAGGIYYLSIGLIYSRAKIRRIIQGEAIEESEELVVGGFEELDELTEKIRHSILEEAGNGASKAELLVQFREQLADYGGLRQPAFRVALTNFLIQKSESICGVSFTTEELNQEWDKLTAGK